MKDLGMFVTVQLLEDTPTELYLGKLREEIGHSYDWKEGKNPNLINNGNIVPCKCDKFVLIVVLDVSSEAHPSSSAEKSAETTKELTPDDRETTRAS